MSNEIMVLAYMIGFFSFGYIVRGFSARKEAARQWNVGREYELNLAKIRRDKRGRYKHKDNDRQTDIKQ